MKTKCESDGSICNATQGSNIKKWINDRRKKNKIHNINRNTTNIDQGLIIDGKAFKEVPHFRSLGILLRSKNAVDEIKSRIAADNKYFYSLELIFRSISISKAVDHYNHNDNNNNNHH